MGAEAKMTLAVAFLGCVAGLIAYESKAESPFLNLSLFKIRLFSCSAVSLLIISTCYTIPFFLLPFYLQNVLLLSPSFIGLLFMVPSIMTVVLAPFSGTMADRFRPQSQKRSSKWIRSTLLTFTTQRLKCCLISPRWVNFQTEKGSISERNDHALSAWRKATRLVMSNEY